MTVITGGDTARRLRKRAQDKAYSLLNSKTGIVQYRNSDMSLDREAADIIEKLNLEIRCLRDRLGEPLEQ